MLMAHIQQNTGDLGSFMAYISKLCTSTSPQTVAKNFQTKGEKFRARGQFAGQGSFLLTVTVELQK
jgi:hypothetical protein